MQDRRSFLKGVTALAGTAGGLSTPFLLLGAAEAAPVYKNKSYGPQKLDVFLPSHKSGIASSKGAPVLAFVHGGAWRLGNRTKIGRKAKYYTDQGFLFMSIGYTLYPRANAIEQAEQIGAATRWIEKNAADYGGNSEQFALMGHSAGCHLASLATLSGSATGVKALICNDTRAYDLPYLARISGGRLPALYAPPFRNRKHWRARSPISYTGLKEQPPSLVLWSNGSNRDRISENFVDALRRDGNDVSVYNGARKYNHLSINSRIGSPRHEVTAAVDRFLMEKLG